LRIALDIPDGDALLHRGQIEAVRHSHPHSVVHREYQEGGTCVTYALGLFQDKTYLAVRGPFFNYKIFAGGQFVDWLLENRRLEEIDEPAPPGCLALYFAAGTWQHVGIASTGGRVISKWGSFPIYDHEVFEAPAQYGNEVRYFAMPRAAEALELFIEFAKSSYGLRDEEIAEAVHYMEFR
jgi:hypothetical protein